MLKRRRAVVFAYHNVGVRCLKVLLAHNVEIALVVSHADNPNEHIWFDSVVETAESYDLPCVTPAFAHDANLMERIRLLKPDFIFSFYYRFMIPGEILALAKIGAFNLHGSLLPKYRGRVPINWAILNGEIETGATLHEMVSKPDAGAIIHQLAVPILPDDIAIEVFAKVVVAAEIVLWQALPNLLENKINRLANLLEQGSYFGGRKPEDGKIDWAQPAQTVYNLYRAVAPPYPGAFTEIGPHKLIIARARLHQASLPAQLPISLPGLQVLDDNIFGVCGDGKALKIDALICQEQLISATQLTSLFSTVSRA